MIKELDEFNFHQQLEENSGIVLVFFTGPHCASCHHLRDLLQENSDLLSSALGEFEAFEVKADKAGALVNEFNVFHLPSMFLYNNGVFHCELHSEAHPKKLIEAIIEALSKPEEDEP
ncbi:MAG: thioredoxin family protein [Methylococcaceae bacterium]|nr:thioredoxin family protein [Methylococcaceae bacterium]